MPSVGLAARNPHAFVYSFNGRFECHSLLTHQHRAAHRTRQAFRQRSVIRIIMLAACCTPAAAAASSSSSTASGPGSRPDRSPLLSSSKAAVKACPAALQAGVKSRTQKRRSGGVVVAKAQAAAQAPAMDQVKERTDDVVAAGSLEPIHTIVPMPLDEVAKYRESHPSAAKWAEGYGVIKHSEETQAQVYDLAQKLQQKAGSNYSEEQFFGLLHALDRITSAAMWLVVHLTYADKVHLDGHGLAPDEFKSTPDGHTGGSLNMVPAYVGYFGANAIAGITRSWTMGQGHCVAAIDSVNLLLDNMLPGHGMNYSVTDEGLTKFVSDFYRFTIGDDGVLETPLGSHVNQHTAGGTMEGGYLGFTELQYVHMPLRGQSLVTFLSDGAFEEQRGADWAPRWWRAEDCGLVVPIMICNGRRIDQRTTMRMEGGADWLKNHLELNYFDPVEFDGRDPAAFVWAITELEEKLKAAGEAVANGKDKYPVRLPYGIAVAPKGAGFYNEGQNLAHNLPLPGNPAKEPKMAELFNECARKLWVPPEELKQSIAAVTQTYQERPKERDHPLVTHKMDVKLTKIPTPEYKPVPEDRANPDAWVETPPMQGVDDTFLAVVEANDHLRPRAGNPDEFKSNRMLKTLESLKFRVTEPEEGMPEHPLGCIITALNEESVCCAALGNKQGINIVVTYEAFADKMHGAVRQELTFAREKLHDGQKVGWLSVPIILTSHTWENGKNEHSHQDPIFVESIMNETSSVARAIFPADYNTAAYCMLQCYQTQAQIWAMPVPKKALPDLISPNEAIKLFEQGALKLTWAGHDNNNPTVILTAVGAYQLPEVLRASRRLREREIAHSVVYMLEPARFRSPRDASEAKIVAPPRVVQELYPDDVQPRVFVAHCRPEVLIGTLQPLNSGSHRTAALGYVNQGGTLDVKGMLFVNRCTWAHVVYEAEIVLGLDHGALLTEEEMQVLDRKKSPHGIIF
eukprot:jgi/Chlat1/6088/Chrsp40S05668